MEINLCIDNNQGVEVQNMTIAIWCTKSLSRDKSLPIDITFLVSGLGITYKICSFFLGHV